MGNLAASDVTVTMLGKGERFQRNVLKFITLAVGDGAKVVPSGGIPLPALGYFGLSKSIRVLDLKGLDAINYRYDSAAHKLRLFAGGIVVPYSPGGGDIKGAANTDSMTADQTSKPVNADFVDTLHAVLTGPAWAYSEDSEPDVPRNVCILLKGKATDGSIIPAGTYTFTVTGVFRGVQQVETISYVFTGGQGTIVADKHRYLYGVKPFDTITSVVITPAHLAVLPVDLLIGVGLGSKLGMPSVVMVAADITKVTKNAADYPVSSNYDATNQTLAMGSLADGDDVSILAKVEEIVGLALAARTLTGTVIGE